MTQTLIVKRTVPAAIALAALCAFALPGIASAKEKKMEKPDQLQAMFIDKLCKAVERSKESGKRFRHEKLYIRYCGDYDPPAPPSVIPTIIKSKFPKDANYPVGPGLDACDVPSGEENTCDTFATVCLEALGGTGWCESNSDEPGSDGTCWCEYDPPTE